MSGLESQVVRGHGPAEQADRAAKTSGPMLVAAFAAIYLIWGSTYLGIKYAIETLPPFLMAGTRFLVAGAILYGWARMRGEARSDEGPRRTRLHWRSAFAIGGLLMLGGNGGVTWAEHRIDSGHAALLVATEPFWVVLMNWWRPGGARPRAQVWGGIVVGLVGVAMLVGIGSSARSMDLVGVAAVLGASVAWATGSVYSTRAPQPSSPTLTSGMNMLAGGALLLLAGTVAGEWWNLDLHRVSGRSLLALGYLIVFGSIVAFTAYTWLLRETSPARAATYAYVNPAVAVFLGWLVAGEELTARTLLASVVIVASVALIVSSGEHDRGSTAD